jgi:hypothetical protein
LELFFIEEQVAGTGLLVKGRMELQVEGREGGVIGSRVSYKTRAKYCVSDTKQENEEHITATNKKNIHCPVARSVPVVPFGFGRLSKQGKGKGL